MTSSTLGQGEPGGGGRRPAGVAVSFRSRSRERHGYLGHHQHVSPRFSQAAGPFDPGAPVHHVVGYARDEPGEQQDVHQAAKAPAGQG
jgi:hypothetical protein